MVQTLRDHRVNGGVGSRVRPSGTLDEHRRNRRKAVAVGSGSRLTRLDLFRRPIRRPAGRRLSASSGQRSEAKI